MSIAVESVKYVYHSGTPVETVALDGVSLSVDRGEWVAVVGHTGSGKSTLAQHLNALLLPMKGSVFVDDIPAVSKGAQLKAIRRRVGLVFQYPEQQLFAAEVKPGKAVAGEGGDGRLQNADGQRQQLLAPGRAGSQDEIHNRRSQGPEECDIGYR